MTIMKLKQTYLSGPKIFFTSDTHYAHKNICRGVSEWGNDDLTRDFQTLEEMNQTLINNINDKVGEDDILFHNGDWSFGGFDKIEEFRNQVNCKNIHLVLGNHDHHIENNKNGIQKLFSSVNQYLRINITVDNGTLGAGKYDFILCHYPIASWHDMNRGVIHLHGHVHLPHHLKISEGKAMDIGMDGNNLEPYSVNKIISLMENQPIKKLSLPKDHHENNL